MLRVFGNTYYNIFLLAAATVAEAYILVIISCKIFAVIN